MTKIKLPAGAVRGNFFHAFDPTDGVIERQGRIIKIKASGCGTVEFFSWLTGEPNGCAEVGPTFWGRCKFYDNDHDMRATHERAKTMICAA